MKPDVQDVVRKHYAAKLKPVADCDSPQEARDSFAARLKRFREAAGVLPVGRVEDLQVTGGEGTIPARAYWPDSSEAPHGAIVFFHGGGFVIGSIDTHDHSARTLCQLTNAIVVSVDYRKAPELPFPAAVDDAYESTRWVCENIRDLAGADLPVAVCGVSAGGTLAAVVCNTARGRFPIAAQVLIYPQTDSSMLHPSMHENAEGYIFTTRDSQWFNELYCARSRGLDKDPRRSPLHEPNLRDLPPAIVATAQYDPLRDEGIAYAARLGYAGNRVTLFNFEGTIHGFFGFGKDVPSAQRDIRLICEATRDMLIAAAG